MGQPQGVRPWLCEALVLARDAGEKMVLAQTLLVFGMYCLTEGSAAQGMRLIGGAAVLTEAGGFTMPKPVRDMTEHFMSAARQALGPEAADAAWMQGRTMPPG